MKYYKLLLLVSSFFISSTIYAGEVQKFGDIDEDADGYISKMEANDYDELKSNWMKADADKDGKLDVSEFSAFEGMGMFQPAEDSSEPEPGAAPTK